MVLAMSPAHPLAAKSPLPITRLDGENLIAFRHGSSVRHAMDQALERAGRVPRTALEGSDLLLIRALAAQGFGVAVRRARSPSSKGRRSIRPLRPAIRLPVVLLWRDCTPRRPRVPRLRRGQLPDRRRPRRDANRSVQVGDLTLHYREPARPRGAPRPRLAHVVVPLARGAEAIAERTAIAIDLPGFGGSDKPTDADYSFRFFGQAITDFLAALEIDHVKLAVHDLGGPVGVLGDPKTVSGSTGSRC